MIRNRTVYAVLGMLLDGELSGYDLKKAFTHRVSHFWAESAGQIYPALEKARELGWVRVRADDRGARKRKAYRLTAKGRAALDEWFREPPAPAPVRNELLLKTFFAAGLDSSALLGHIAHVESAERAKREQFFAFDEEIERLAASPEQEALWKLTLASGKHQIKARLAWCREARAVVEGLLESVE